MEIVELYNPELEQKILDLVTSGDLSDILHGILLPESDYGFAEIYRIYDSIFVFLIPQYGGTPSFYKSYGRHSIKLLITDLKQIT